MLRFSKIKLILFSFFLLSSCATYFLKKKCEATNWFEYGEKVALSGQRLDQDQFINQCRKAEADVGESNLDKGFKQGMNRYCLPEQAYITGKNGEFFVEDMCGGYPINSLKQKHSEGVRDYCQPMNGVTAGATGKKYNNICPSQLEKTFLPEFKKGRKQYLTAQVQQKKDEIEASEREIGTLENQKRDLTTQMLAFQNSGAVIRRETRIGPMGAVTTEQVQGASNGPDAQNRKEELRRQTQDLDWKINSRRDEQKKLRKEIGDLNAEMAGL